MLRKIWILFLFPILINAQILAPAKWKTAVKELSNNEFQIEISSKIEAGWHLYSQSHPNDGVGIPAVLNFEPNQNIELVGKVAEEGKLIDEYSKLFEQNEKFYRDNVKFIQRLKVKGNQDVEVKFNIEYQMCDDSRCLPPDYKEFSLKLKSADASKSEETIDKKVVPESQEKIAEDFEEDTINASSISSVKNENQDIEDDLLSDTERKDNGLLKIFILGFLGGLAALLMPCIFPMIPLTVSLFTKQNKSQKEGILKALVYGLSIIVIYVLLGLIITAIFGASALNEMSTNPWVNIAFFLIFLIFAISFFGAFEIRLPSKWINLADKGADREGFIGIFFMAFTLALVSFSCTGPIIGSLLVRATQESNYFSLVIGMLGFSSALAIPFTLFAMFPSWLNALPQSGGWLNTVKVTLGFIELAFALKFLSNADLVWQLHYLEREVFLAIWITIFALLGVYLLGKFRMPLDSPTESIGIGRLFFAITSFSLALYMLPGLWGAPLQILSGLTPPMHYSEAPRGFHEGVQGNQNSIKINDNIFAGPHGIPVFKDFELAAAHSKKVNKPLLLDFTGHACANCRKVEDRVWSDPRIKKALTEDVILVSLYVDDRRELAKEEQVYSEAFGRKLKTIGNKWTAFEITHFKANAQPYYIIVDENLKRYSKPLEAEYDIEVYLNWIKKGVKRYAEREKE